MLTWLLQTLLGSPFPQKKSSLPSGKLICLSVPSLAHATGEQKAHHPWMEFNSFRFLCITAFHAIA